MGGRVFFLFFLRTCFFALIDRKWLGRNCYLLLVLLLVSCYLLYLLLVPVIAQRIDAENENEKNKKKKKKLKCDNSFFSFSLVKI